MLAASTHTSTTDWIVGSIAIVAFLALGIWILPAARLSQGA
jgi:hypothetical protein